MAYPHPFLRLVMGGRMYFSDIFTMSLSLSNGGIPGTEPPEEVPQTVIDACAGFFEGGVLSSGCALQYVKLNQIGTDGRYTQDWTARHDYTPEVPGVTPYQYLPPQVTLVVTLRTGVNRGLAARGRMFLPAPNCRVESTGMIQLQDRVDIGNATALFLEELNAAMPGYRVTVMSDGGSRIGSAGAARLVTEIAVGRVLDTMRSRRTDFVEDYHVVSVDEPVAP